MGASIGPIGRDVAAIQTQQPRINRANLNDADNRASDDARPRLNADDPPSVPSDRDPDSFEAGFGQNTLSPAGAAITALGRGVEAVRSSLPSLEERRVEIGVRLEEDRGRLEQDPVQPLQPVEPARPVEVAAPQAEAANPVTEFIDSSNAATAEARLREDTPPPPALPARSAVDEETFDPPRSGSPQVLDVRV